LPPDTVAAPCRRTRHGGYRLAKPPWEMSVRETLEAFETLAPVPCLVPGRTDGTTTGNLDRSAPSVAETAPEQPDGTGDDACTLDVTEKRCPTRAAWYLVDQKVRETLDSMTLSDLLDEVHERGLEQEMIHAS
jgi:DNA-binding IscR family transcriptional regulator